MDKPMTPVRRTLLRQLESILGHSFYNPSIRNYGPGGGRVPDGRSFRYPLTMRLANGEKLKVSQTIPTETPDELLRTGYYAVGANQLEVICGLEKVLEHLEENFGLIIDPKCGTRERPSGSNDQNE